ADEGADAKQDGFACGNLLIFDEPTAGMHFGDVAILVKLFQRLVDAGNTIIVIEHNLEVIKCADWIIDLGPEAGDEGGRLVAAGAPEAVARIDASHTGRFLRKILGGTRDSRPGKTRMLSDVIDREENGLSRVAEEPSFESPNGI